MKLVEKQWIQDLLKNKNINCVTRLYEIIQGCHISNKLVRFFYDQMPNGLFRCKLSVNHIGIISGYSRSKQQAKNLAAAAWLKRYLNMSEERFRKKFIGPFVKTPTPEQLIESLIIKDKVDEERPNYDTLDLDEVSLPSLESCDEKEDHNTNEKIRINDDSPRMLPEIDTIQPKPKLRSKNEIFSDRILAEVFSYKRLVTKLEESSYYSVHDSKQFLRMLSLFKLRILISTYMTKEEIRRREAFALSFSRCNVDVKIIYVCFKSDVGSLSCNLNVMYKVPYALSEGTVHPIFYKEVEKDYEEGRYINAFIDNDLSLTAILSLNEIYRDKGIFTISVSVTKFCKLLKFIKGHVDNVYN